MMVCIRCSGLIATRYDVALREEERYCLNCGATPDLTCRRLDGGAREDILLCVKCKREPQCIVRDGYGRAHDSTQMRYCAACRVEHAEKMRVHQNKKRNATGKKSGLGNIRVRRVA